MALRRHCKVKSMAWVTRSAALCTLKHLKRQQSHSRVGVWPHVGAREAGSGKRNPRANRKRNSCVRVRRGCSGFEVEVGDEGERFPTEHTETSCQQQESCVRTTQNARVCGICLFPDVVSQSVGTHKVPDLRHHRSAVIPNLACIRDSQPRLQN